MGRSTRGRRGESGPAEAPPPRTLLLDLDGTLIDSARLILASYRHTMRTHLGEEPPDAAWLETMGQPLHVQLRDFARSEDEAEAMLRTYLEHNHRAHDELIRSFPEVREAVGRLRDRGVRLGIVTSKRREGALQGLECCDYPLEWFDAVVTASDVDRHKPDPKPVLVALEEMGEPEAGRALFVGDSVHDLRAGRAAGTRTAAALWGPYDRDALAPGEPDHWLEGARELETLLAAGRQAG